MRPVRLLLEGFTSFSGLTEVDFGDADLFALAGPTGAGKSSLVDAMVFALYGRVPRLDGRLVAPLIALGRQEARVAFEFTVGGERYVAGRVIRRTRTGASTKEAVLERDGEPVAEGERDVTEAVEALLGLGYDHFTSCVVLPQGKFATLLHANASERQDLLVSLLRLGLYDRMRDVARHRMLEAAAEVTTADGVLATLAAATPEAREQVADRLTRLQALRADADAAHVKLERLRSERDAASAEATAAAADLRLLTAVRVPEGLADHSEALAAAREAVEAQDKQAESLDEAIEAADAQLGDLPARVDLEAAARAHRERAEAVDERTGVEEQATASAEALAAASLVVEASEEAHRLAVAELEAVKRQHLAHVLADGVAIGEPCPVCTQEVTALPDLGEADDLTAAEAAVHSAAKGVDAARARLAKADRAHARHEARLAAAADRIDTLDAELADHPDPQVIAEQLAAVTELDGALRRARLAAKRARAEATAAREHIAAVEATEARERRRFDETRDALGRLGPPVPARVDLAEDWRALVAWVAEERPRRAETAESAVARAQAVDAERAEAVELLVDRVRAEGVEAEGDDVRGPLASAIGDCSARLERLDHDLAACERQRERRAAAERRGAVAKELTRLLAANQFEKWVLDEALALLVEAATGRLRALTDGAFSLAVDAKGGFEVVDHRNADERRSARTLSGGETFLAALALALALADQIGTLATGGAARLESMLIDEGFGSLDPDALDTVATAMEELGSQGRVVGLISHVPDLAARMPVRFDVTAGPGGSTVTRSVA